MLYRTRHGYDIFLTAGLLLAALLATQCGQSTITVRTKYDQAADFKRYRTFGWNKAQDKLSDRGEEAVRTTVTSELEKKGIRLARPGEEPDFLVGYAARTETQTAHRPIVTSRGPTMLLPETVEAGMLILVFIDPKTDKTVWRSEAVAVIDDQRNPHRKIPPAVKKMLAQYPPK